ncbi:MULTISPECIES: hypothetical protein [unclassified Microbacterium]|uniref:hypothetical protein n=1 Tax=unclassified Microbacterium TaxID=2609290 RepID=UPI003018DB96
MASINVSAYFADGRSVTLSGEVSDELVSASVAPMVAALAAPAAAAEAPQDDSGE